jgi:hypothetical protein
VIKQVNADAASPAAAMHSGHPSARRTPFTRLSRGASGPSPEVPPFWSLQAPAVVAVTVRRWMTRRS